MFNNNITSLIKENVSILHIISKRINIQKKGNKFLALCPFHKEKTPSFHINNEKGFFHCFGCGISGDVFKFLTEYDKLSFKEALEYLAEYTGVNLSNNYSKHFKKTLLGQSSTVTNYYTLLNEVCNWYHSQLLSKENEVALKYFLDRGLSRYTVETFKLGYAPKNSNSLYSYLVTKGYNEKDMITLGLIHSTSCYTKQDVFKSRVIFPIKNKSGKVIAFGGRSLNNDLPKYLNSKESDVYYKKFHLYGLNESLKLLKNNPYIILVEGYLDTIMLQQEGFPAVATLGTAVSSEQLNTLVQLKVPLYICLDSDKAGIQASLKVAKILLEIINENTLPKFIHLPSNEDPDSYLRKFSTQSFSVLLKSAMPLSEYLWTSTVKSDKIDTPEVKVLYQKIFKTYCSTIHNLSLKEEFSKFFFNKLNSLDSSSTNLNLRNNYSGYLKHNKVVKVNCGINKDGSLSSQYILVGIYFLLAYVIYCPEIYNDVEEKFSVLEFDNKVIDNLKQTIVYLLEQQALSTEELKQELACRGYSTILNEIMNMEIIKRTLSNLQEKQSVKVAFCDLYKNLLRQELKKDAKAIKVNILQSEKFTSKDKFVKVTNCLKGLHNEYQQTLNISKGKL